MSLWRLATNWAIAVHKECRMTMTTAPGTTTRIIIVETIAVKRRVNQLSGMAMLSVALSRSSLCW
jgi:hypothetical protein